MHEQENLSPRRVLDQQGSNDFSAYLQETAGSPTLRCSYCPHCRERHGLAVALLLCFKAW
jgi:hypothetical protein